MQGIYQWTVSRPDGSALVYVGQAINIEDRKRKYTLGWTKDEEHDPNNVVLRRAVLKYGTKAVHFDVLEFVDDVADLTAAEQKWFDLRVAELGRRNVMNIVRPGVNPLLDPEVRSRHKVTAQDAGKKRSEDPEWRANVTAANQNKSPEWRANIAAACAKRYVFLDPEGNRVEVYNLRQFCLENGLNGPCMSDVAKGKRPHHRGWRKAE